MGDGEHDTSDGGRRRRGRILVGVGAAVLLAGWGWTALAERGAEVLQRDLYDAARATLDGVTFEEASRAAVEVQGSGTFRPEVFTIDGRDHEVARFDDDRVAVRWRVEHWGVSRCVRAIWTEEGLDLDGTGSVCSLGRPSDRG